MKRVVADTNIFVSALQFGGKPKQLRAVAAEAGVIGITIQHVADFLGGLQEQS